jgi:hypothetical protein
MRRKSFSGVMLACSRKCRGIRWPEVLLAEPKLTCLPLRSESCLMPESVLAMKTDWNLVSSSRCAIGTILPPERSCACTCVKPPNHTRSTRLFTRASTAAG